MTFSPCVVVPVYNHGAGAKLLTEQLVTMKLPVILVNDGSSQNCSVELRSLVSKDHQVDLIEYRQNRGKGHAMLEGFRAAQKRGFSHVLQIDADGQHNVRDIPEFFATAIEHPDHIVTGRPVYDETVPKGRLIGRYATHICVWIETLSFAIPDSMCGFRVYPLARVVELIEREPIGQRMDFDTDILVRLYWRGSEVISLPTNVTYPEDGISHFDMWWDNVRISWMHTRLLAGMICRLPRLVSRHHHQ